MRRQADNQRTFKRRGWDSVAAVVGLCALALAGCHAAPRNFLNDNDQLRRENLELREKVEQLQKKIDLRLAEIQSLEQRIKTASPPAVAGAKVPQAVKIAMDRYSGPIDTNHDGIDDAVRVYLLTQDGEGRFIPVAGRAVVQVVAIEPGRPPALLVEKTFEPNELDAAYRSGLTGTHYTLEVPLVLPPPKGLRQATVKATLTDAASGAQLIAEQAFPLASPRK